MMRKSLLPLFLATFLALVAFPLSARVVVCGLKTDSMPQAMGIDNPRPHFSYQLKSDEYSILQKAYRLKLSETLQGLEANELVYDSGVVYDDSTTNIPYHGRSLKGSTRYYWSVDVMLSDGRWIKSEPDWFETALMDKGWSGAKWIGSERTPLSRFRTFFNIHYTVQIPEDSQQGVFVYSVKDEGNYISVALDVSEASDPRLLVDYCVEGELRHCASLSLSHIFGADQAHRPHRLSLKVSTPGYHLKSLLTPVVDGVTLEALSMYPYPGGEYICDWARLHSIGFRQPEGQKARFWDISIDEDNWNTVLHRAPQQSYELAGDGKMCLWQPYNEVSAPMLRKEFELDKPLRSARLYVTARGIYEFSINGKRVGGDWFNPGWTDYRYRIMYNSYDVTSLLKEGGNAMGVMLGSGWFSDLNIFTSAYVDPYGIRQSLLSKLELRFEDGTVRTIVSDGSWKKYDHGPVIRNGFQFGEDYDARLEQDGWTYAGFDDSAWEPAVIYDAPAPTVKIQSYVGLPIRNHITLDAVSVSEPAPGCFVYDFGQNMVGVPRIEGLRGERGQVVTVRYAEMLYPELIPSNPVPPYTEEMYRQRKGQLYTENYRGAISIDTYTMRGGDKPETFVPSMTDHGFRYLSISGIDSALPLDCVKGLVLESIGEATGFFECSDPDINRLFNNIQWGQRGNFQTVPTDCPQRDERQGWTGDAQVFARAATYFSPYVDNFYKRWLYSMRDNQNIDGSYFNYYPVTGRPPYGFTNNNPGWIGWMEAGIIIPWQMYQQFGDIEVLREHYASMSSYMDYLDRNSKNFLQPNMGIGDHLALERTDIGLTNTAYYAYDAYMMSRIAAALGKQDDARRYEQLWQNVKAAFVKTYIDKEGYTVAPKGDGTVRVDTQTSYALPLYFGLLDGELRDLCAAKLARNVREHGNKLTTGFIGTPYLCSALSASGYDELAYALFEQREYPSWLYSVLQGATTMWERWNSYTIENGFGPVDMNSFNHYAYGSIAEWMYARCLGIGRDENAPGYRNILLSPTPGGSLSYASGGFETPQGVVRSAWKREEGRVAYSFTIPAGSTADLSLQAPSKRAMKLLKGKEGAGRISYADGRVSTRLGSGEYEIEITLQ